MLKEIWGSINVGLPLRNSSSDILQAKEPEGKNRILSFTEFWWTVITAGNCSKIFSFVTIVDTSKIRVQRVLTITACRVWPSSSTYRYVVPQNKNRQSSYCLKCSDSASFVTIVHGQGTAGRIWTLQTITTLTIFYLWHNISVGTATRPNPTSSDGQNRWTLILLVSTIVTKKISLLQLPAVMTVHQKFGENQNTVSSPQVL